MPLLCYRSFTHAKILVRSNDKCDRRVRYLLSPMLPVRRRVILIAPSDVSGHPRDVCEQRSKPMPPTRAPASQPLSNRAAHYRQCPAVELHRQSACFFDRGRETRSAQPLHAIVNAILVSKLLPRGDGIALVCLDLHQPTAATFASLRAVTVVSPMPGRHCSFSGLALITDTKSPN